MDRLQDLVGIIRLEWKWLTVTNTLAYNRIINTVNTCASFISKKTSAYSAGDF
jgi:hypothetical protein